MSITSDPYEVAASLETPVEYGDLPEGILGLWTGEKIILRPGQTNRDERSVLAHELGHVHLGEAHILRHLSPKIENACDVYAAEMLIDEDLLEKLARTYPDNPGQIAYELDVAEWVLDAYVRAHPLEPLAA